MNVPTYKPDYTTRRRYDQETGQRIRIRHDILDAAEQRLPKGMTLKAFLNEVLAERFL